MDPGGGGRSAKGAGPSTMPPAATPAVGAPSSSNPTVALHLSKSHSYAAAALFTLALRSTLAESTADARGAPPVAQAGLWRTGGLLERMYSHLGLPSRAWAGLVALTAPDAPLQVPLLLDALSAPPETTADTAESAAASSTAAADAAAKVARLARELLPPTLLPPPPRVGRGGDDVAGGVGLPDLIRLDSGDVAAAAPPPPRLLTAPSLIDAPTDLLPTMPPPPTPAAPPQTARAPGAPPPLAAVSVLWELLTGLVGGTAGDLESSDRWYDARGRCALARAADWMRVPSKTLAALEALLASELPAHARHWRDGAAAGAAPVVASAEKSSARHWRTAGVIGAAIGGGALLAVTGGLAAPAIALGLASMSAAAAAAGTMGAGAAIGIASAHAAAAAGAAATVAATPVGTAAVTAGAGAWGAWVGTSKASKFMADSDDFGMQRLWDGGGAEEDDGVRLESAQNERWLAVTVCVSGWIEKMEDYVSPWATLELRDSEKYALVWETQPLMAVAHAATNFLSNKAVTEAITQGIMHTALASILVAFALPNAVLSAANWVDNTWAVAVARSDRAAEELAEQLCRSAHGDRPLVLLGFSLGGRVVFHALLELAKRGRAGVVQHAVIMGAPVVADAAQWAAARGTVAGRLVNAHSGNDWLLAMLFRTSLALGPAAGLAAVPVPGVENVNVGAVVSGHSDWCARMPEVLEILGFGGAN